MTTKADEIELSWNVENAIGQLLNEITIDGEEYAALDKTRAFMQRRRHDAQIVAEMSTPEFAEALAKVETMTENPEVESFRRFCASATDMALSRQGLDLMTGSPMRSVWWAEMNRRGLPT